MLSCLYPYLYSRDLSRSDDPYILNAIDNDREDYLTALVNLKQCFFNQKLLVNGYVFLEEVFDSFGLEKPLYGLAVGWEIDSENGDGFIDLGYRVVKRENGSKLYYICPNADGFISSRTE